MLRYLPLVVKNSLRNRRRSILTICSIAASLCLLGILMAIYQAFFHAEPTPSQALRLVVRNRVSLVFPMPIYYREKIRQVPGVREVYASQWFGGIYKDARDPANFFARFAVEPAKLFVAVPEIQTSEEEKRAFLGDRAGAMIGRTLAQRLNLRLGDRITIRGDIFPINPDFTIRAIYDWPDYEETMYFHIDYLFESLSQGRRDFAGTFVILADAPESVPRIIQAVDGMFRNASVQTRTETEQAFGLSFVAFLGNVKLFILSICAAVTFTILLVSANTMAMSVRERIREVGILKTLGFSSGSILGIILGEAALISAVGGALGCGLAAVLCYGVRQGPGFFVQLKTLSIDPLVAILCVAVALAIGIVSALIPAWSASRTSILDSVRFTG